MHIPTLAPCRSEELHTSFKNNIMVFIFIRFIFIISCVVVLNYISVKLLCLN